jgi:hypothetical protein
MDGWIKKYIIMYFIYIYIYNYYILYIYNIYIIIYIIYIYNATQPLKKHEIWSLEGIWVKLEHIVLAKISQAQKDKYCMS